jgi:hypothetical protein
MSNAHTKPRGRSRHRLDCAESGKRLLNRLGIKIGTGPDTIRLELKNGFKQGRTKRLRDFALVFAVYAALSQRADFSTLVTKCAKLQGMQSGTAAFVETAVLRCILGLKRGSPQSRRRDRVQVRKTARAIENLMDPGGPNPEEVHAMKAGPGRSVHAFSRRHKRGATAVGASKVNRTIRGLPELASKPGRRFKIIVKSETDGSLRYIRHKELGGSDASNSPPPPKPAIVRLKELMLKKRATTTN